MATIAEMLVKLGVDVSDVNKGIQKFERTSRGGFRKVSKEVSLLRRDFLGITSAVKGFGSALLAAFTVRGVARAINQTADFSDRVGKLSERLGLTTEFLSEMKFAAESAGTTFDVFAVASQRAIRRLEQFRDTGKGEAAEALRILGAGLEEAVKRGESFESLLPRIANAFRGLDSEAKRVLAAMKLFDTEGVALVQLFQQGAGAIDELRTKARALGLTITADGAKAAAEYKDAVLELQGAWQGLVQELSQTVIPVLKEILDLTKESIQNIRGTGPLSGSAFLGPGGPGRVVRGRSSPFLGTDSPPILPGMLARETAGPPAPWAGLSPELAGGLFTDAFRMARFEAENLGEAITDVMTRASGLGGELKVMAEETQTTYTSMLEQFRVTSEDFFALIPRAVQTFASGVATALGQVVTSTGSMAEALKGALKQIAANVISMLAQLAIEFIAFEVLGDILRTKRTVSEVGSQAAIAGAATQAAAVKELGLVGLVVGPALAAAASALVSVAASKGFSRGSATKFAEGGVVTGPTLGLVGEAGAEAIIPLDRLESMLGRSSRPQVIRMEIDGRTLGEVAFDYLPRAARTRGIKTL